MDITTSSRKERNAVVWGERLNKDFLIVSSYCGSYLFPQVEMMMGNYTDSSLEGTLNS